MFNSTPQFFPASSVPWSYSHTNLYGNGLGQSSGTVGGFSDSSNALLLRKFDTINSTPIFASPPFSDQGIVKYTFANGFTSPTIDSQVIGPELETSQNHYIRYPTSLSPNGLYIVSRNNNAPDRDFFLQKISDLNSTGLTVPSTSIPNPTTISSYTGSNNRVNNRALWKSDSSAFYTMIVLNNGTIYIRINSVDSSGNVSATTSSANTTFGTSAQPSTVWTLDDAERYIIFHVYSPGTYPNYLTSYDIQTDTWAYFSTGFSMPNIPMLKMHGDRLFYNYTSSHSGSSFNLTNSTLLNSTRTGFVTGYSQQIKGSYASQSTWTGSTVYNSHGVHAFDKTLSLIHI